MTTATPVRTVDDITLIVSGQGGDGSLTVSSLLGKLLRARGLQVLTERDVLSRIKGGRAAAALRASGTERRVLGDRFQLAVILDEEGVHAIKDRIADDGILIYDDSETSLPEGLVPAGVWVMNAPFAQLAVRQFGRILYKNSIALGLASRVLAIPDDEMRGAFEAQFSRMGQAVLDANVSALESGFAMADEAGVTSDAPVFALDRHVEEERLLLTGNEATGFGFLVGGGRFFAGYPITPATDVMEYLSGVLPRFGGIVWQAEDELASVNMALGASLAGVRAMTATSGPGLALMQEGLSQAGSAEIPLVVVTTQRGGPSTGLPTKIEQSDLDMMVFGGNGEFPRIVLAPGDAEDAFYLAVQACNLAQQFQCPVYIALDQGISQNSVSVKPFDLERVPIDQGKRLDTASVAALAEYGRYEITEDGVSPYVVPGTPGGVSLVTGNERDPFGLVSTNAANRKAMMDKRARKLETAKAELPTGRRIGPAGASIGLIGIGSAYGSAMEAQDELAALGIDAQVLQPRTVWPVLDETIDFIAAREVVYVVEQNSTGQLAKLLIREGADSSKMRHVLRYDGIALSGGDVTEVVVAAGGAR